MTREDILRMAREAGLRSAVLLHLYGGKEAALTDSELDELRGLERFATMVAAAAQAKEREACAQVCDDLKPTNPYYESYSSDWDVGTLDCAEAIRARSNT